MIPRSFLVGGDEFAEVFVADFGFRVGHHEERVVDGLKTLFVEVESQLAESVLQAVTSRSGGENDFALLSTNEGRVDDFVGGSLFEDAVLVDATAVGVGVGADHRLVSLNHHAGVSGDQPGDGQELGGIDAGFKTEVILANEEAHDDLFERGVASALANAIDGDFNLPCASEDAGQSVCGGHAKVVVAVAAEDSLVAVRDVLDDALDKRSVFLGVGKSGGVGDVDRGRAGVDDGFDDSVDVLSIGSTGVFHEVLNVVGELAGNFDRVYAGFERLIWRHSELVDKVVFADTQTGVDSSRFSWLEGFSGDFDILLPGSSQTTDGDAFDLFGEGVDALKVAR